LSKYAWDEFERRIKFSQRMFCNMETRLKDFLDYVPLSFDHLTVYSAKLVTIILETGPEIINSFDLVSFPTRRHFVPVRDEVDSLREKLLEKEKSLRERKQSLSFKQYSDFLNKAISLRTRAVEIKNLDAYTIPFEKATPGWWNAHNLLKHDKYNNLKKATLLNALKSVGALFWLTYYYSGWLPVIPDKPLHFSCDLFGYVHDVNRLHRPLKKI